MRQAQAARMQTLHNLWQSISREHQHGCNAKRYKARPKAKRKDGEKEKKKLWQQQQQMQQQRQLHAIRLSNATINLFSST